MTSGDPNPENSFREWMNIQEQDHSELIQAQNLCRDGGDHNNELRELLEKTTKHFEDYIEKRSCLARNGRVSSYFSPTWCSSLEGSLLWVAGCRPTSFIRLLYMLSGLEIESQLLEDFQGQRSSTGNNLCKLSAAQLNLINELHMKTIKEEEKLSSRMASLQEDIADHPVAIIAKELNTHNDTSREAEEALDEVAGVLFNVLEEGDKLRLNTLKQLLNILKPIQAVEFLAASKKLHLCLHSWGQRRDRQQATTQDRT